MTGIDQFKKLPIVAVAVADTGFQFGAGVFCHDKRIRQRLDDVGRASCRVQIDHDTCIGNETCARITEEA